jgi:hypothetical protein
LVSDAWWNSAAVADEDLATATLADGEEVLLASTAGVALSTQTVVVTSIVLVTYSHSVTQAISRFS